MEPLPVLMHFPMAYLEGETRQYQLAQHLAEHRPVTFVEDHDGPGHPMSPSPRFVGRDDVGRVSVLTKHDSALHRRIRRVAPAAAAVLHARALRGAMRSRGVDTFWTYTFGPFDDWSRSGPSVRTAVEINDPPFEGDADEWWRRTGVVCRRADLVTSTAAELVDELAAQGVPAELVPNAVSASLITHDPRPDPSRPATALYVGTVDWRFDVDLVDDVAGRLPSVDFVLAGRINGNRRDEVDKLRRRPNVTLLGAVSETDKADLLRTATLGLVPFRAGALSDGVNPTKVYEYSAYGLPVVSVASRACRELSPPVLVASGADEFVGAVQVAIDDPPDRRSLLDFATANTWGHRAERLHELLAERESSARQPAGAR